MHSVVIEALERHLIETSLPITKPTPQ